VDPSHATTRYGRTWRFSRPVDLDDAFFGAKLGFVRSAETEETIYDEQLQDFVTRVGPASEGSFSVFVVDTENELIAFEERPPLIRRQSFIGALRGLFEEADFPARVELLIDPASFQGWAAQVERITRIKAVVFNPNPGWATEAGAVRQVVEEANAAKADVTVTPKPDESLNPEAAWISGALQQISEHGQGRLTATGKQGDRNTRWESWTKLRVARMADEEAASPERIWRWLVDKLKDLYGG
jgi:hypothetical protein